MDTAAPRFTRIQHEKREIILEAALEVFSTHGFRGAALHLAIVVDQHPD